MGYHGVFQEFCPKIFILRYKQNIDFVEKFSTLLPVAEVVIYIRIRPSDGQLLGYFLCKSVNLRKFW